MNRWYGTPRHCAACLKCLKRIPCEARPASQPTSPRCWTVKRPHQTGIAFVERARLLSFKRRVAAAQSFALTELAEEIAGLATPAPEDLVTAIAERIEQGSSRHHQCRCFPYCCQPKSPTLRSHPATCAYRCLGAGAAPTSRHTRPRHRATSAR
jgi:hypothetical protein